MIKVLLRIIMGISMVTLMLGAPPAYAVLGIRAARAVIAARKAKQMTSSSSSASEEAYAQEKAKFSEPAVQENKAVGQRRDTNSVLENKEMI